MNDKPKISTPLSDRKSYLKNLRARANQFLRENIDLKSTLTKSWEHKTVENNIKNLKEIIASINMDLEDKAIKQHVQEKMIELISGRLNKMQTAERLLKGFKETSTIYEMARFSVAYSIKNDFYWVRDGTVGDHLEIALGAKTPESFEIYCEQTIAYIVNTILPVLKNLSEYQALYDLLSSTINQFDSQPFTNTNILLMVAVENMTRVFCSHIYSKQNPHLDKVEVMSYIATRQSLETLILKSNWNNDIPINVYDASLKAKFIDDPQLTLAASRLKKRKEYIEYGKAVSLEVLSILNDASLSDDEKSQASLAILNNRKETIAQFDDVDKDIVYISIKVELQFLIRRFKDDRNSIIHGDFKQFNKKWKSYIYFSAIVAIWKLKLRLDKLYAM